MFAINMAREPGLPSLWVGFAHSATSKVSSKDCETPIGKLHGETSNFQLYKRLWRLMVMHCHWVKFYWITSLNTG